MLDDAYFMRLALQEAHKAKEQDEVPVGCVVVSDGRIVAKSHNLTQTLNDVTAHAEMQAITAAANYLGGKYLRNCTMYITLEPCTMCAGALSWSQITRVVYGAQDPSRGYQNFGLSLHPKTTVQGGVLQEECSELLLDFFRSKR